MKAFAITTYPKPILKQRVKEALTVPSDIVDLISRMKITMQENDGIGLAAPQINRSERVIIIQDVRDEEKAYGFLNPRIVKKGRKQTMEEEGCLSLPGLFLPIKRFEKVEVAARTSDNKKVRITASGLAARIFQHEVDHLNGKLIIDHLSPWTRFKIRKHLKKFKKGNASSP